MAHIEAPYYMEYRSLVTSSAAGSTDTVSNKCQLLEMVQKSFMGMTMAMWSLTLITVAGMPQGLKAKFS